MGRSSLKAESDFGGIGAGRHAEVVFELAVVAVAVVHEVDAGVDIAIFDSAKLRNILVPFGGVIADEVVALPGETVSALDVGSGVGAVEAHPNHAG